jgi:signal transduction histidine kinase/ligand-binding sensor domain-containing protein/DNA-binding response OmpR family regulator
MAYSYSFDHLGIKNGLSNNYVLDIAQDKQGFIWIASESGLSRFDGKNFITFDESTSELISNTLNTLFYDDEENILWIGSKEGISLLDCSTLKFKNYISHDNVIIKSVVQICRASDGGIWLTNHHGGIMHYDKKSKLFSPYFDETIKEAKFHHWCSFDDGKGVFYIGHSRLGLSIIDLKTNTVKNYRNDPKNPKSLPGDRIYSIYADHTQNIWIGTDKGLALFNPKTEDFSVFKHNPNNPFSLIADHVYCIEEMNDGLLWIATDIGGISIMDAKNGHFVKPEDVRFTNISAQVEIKSLSSNNIRKILQDSFGNIWIANYGTGIDFISRSKRFFNVLPYTTISLKNKPVWGICTDNKNRVWVGSENEIALFEKNKLKKTISVTDYVNRPYVQVFSITCDRQGLFWLGLYDDGLLTYNEHTNRFNRIKLDVENMDVITFYEDFNGKMWIGAEYGVYSYMKGKIVREENIMRQLKDRSIYGILHDTQGKLWIGTYGRGVFVFDKKEKLITNLWTENGFCSNSVSHLFLDSKGGVWVATRNGAAYIEDTNYPEKYKNYSIKQGLVNNHIRAIHEDNAGNIWLSTFNGISLWNKKNNKFENHDFREGLPLGNFIEGSGCSTSDGTIYFGSLDGVCYFEPKILAIKDSIASIQIIDCIGFNQQTENKSGEYIIPLNKGNIELAYNQNTFRISFVVPDYSQNNLVEYAYKMKGIENIWHNTQGENHVSFRNLPPGKYHFQVKAKLQNQEWRETQTASLFVTINPPIWLTWYAKFLYIAVICACIFFLTVSYKNRLKLKTSLAFEKKNSELNDERLRFYTNITHELRTPLTLILGPLEDLVHTSDIQAEHKKKINMIYGSATRLLNLINQLLEFRKTETQNRKLTVRKGDFVRLINEIGLHYKELCRNSKTNFHIQIENPNIFIYYDEDMITSILNNLLSNAVKYTPMGEIRLVLRSVEEKTIAYTEIEVSDTGYGIDTKSLPHIFERYYQVKDKHQASGTGIGLALVKSLVDLHEGILTVESTLGKGTTFRLRFLTENMYQGAVHADNIPECEPEKEEISDVRMNEENNTRPIILVIEDNSDIREYIANSLSPTNIVYTATNGKEGLQLAYKETPDIILSDIMMPEMDGLELCRIMKADIRTSHIPVILLTAKDSDRDKEKGYKSGADSYLTKPFNSSLLLSRINNILETRKKLANQVIAYTKSIEPKMAHKPQYTGRMSSIDEEFLTKITTLIEENLNKENLDISFLRKKVNMSHSTFYRKIKALTGVSANEFIRKIKIKNSLKLLLTGSYNVSETAYMTGFNDVDRFRQYFKAEYGLPPLEFIRTTCTDACSKS